MREEVLTPGCGCGAPWSAQDEERYRRLFADPVVRRVAVAPAARAARPARGDAALARDAARWAGDGFGPWLRLARDGGDFVGRVGLARADVAGEPAGRGRLGRARARTRAPGWPRRPPWPPSTPPASSGCAEVVAFTLPENVASRRVMERASSRSTGPSSTTGCPTCSTAGRPEPGRRRAARRAARSRSGAACAAASRAAGGGRRGGRRRHRAARPA